MRAVYLIRHGQTVWNKEEIFRGRADIPLNDFGRRQARMIADFLQERGLRDAVFFSSPLKRARETAKIAGGLLSEKDVHTVEAFTDINFGPWEGKARVEVEKLYPELYRLWQEEPASVAFPEGESLREAAARAVEAFSAIAEKYAANDIIIVSHRVINKLLLCSFLEAGLNSFWRIRQDTACINIFVGGETRSLCR